MYDETQVGRLALVHEWLDSRSGSEKTFEQMSQTFPSADLYALTRSEDVDFQLGSEVYTTAIQRSRVLRARRSVALPVMPLAWKMLRPPSYDLVVSSTHAFARYFPARDAVHLSYVYTPLRYAWLPDIDGRGSRRVLAPARAALRTVDKASTRSVRSFAGISNVVCRRIESFYGRAATVVYPPVDTGFFRDKDASDPARLPLEGPFILGVSRWISYKRLDLVIAAGESIGLPVVIAGAGPDEAQLRSLANEVRVPVHFAKSPSDEALRDLYRAASVVVFPPEEDFGIVPVEAQAAGTPVVALAEGGSLDTVKHGSTGYLVERQDPALFGRAVEQAERLGPLEASSHVEQFSIPSFRRSFRRWVMDSLG